jgi:DNA-directed RNA polymerase beta subunit
MMMVRLQFATYIERTGIVSVGTKVSDSDILIAKTSVIPTTLNVKTPFTHKDHSMMILLFASKFTRYCL